MQSETSPKPNAGLTFGIILIVAGVLALLSQFSGGGYFMPIALFAVGVGFFAGMLVGGRNLGTLAIPGAIFVALGVAALIDVFFPAWQSWLYIIPLVIVGIGLGLVIFGYWSEKPDLVSGGWKTIRGGLGTFIGIAITIEIILTLLGVGSGSPFWPGVLIAVGVVVLLWRVYLVAAGKDDETRRGQNLFEPVLWIGIGFLWLQILQGTLPLGNLFVLLNLWPVLLIFAGVGILFGRRQPLVSLALGILLVAGMVYAAFNSSQIGIAGRAPWALFQVNTGGSGRITEFVSGSGVIASEDRAVGDFDSVRFNGGGEVRLAQGASSGLTVETDDNLLPYITTEVRGGELVIGVKPGASITPSRNLVYTLTVDDLQRLDITGAALIKAGTLEVDDLDLTVSGYANITIDELTASRLDVEINGSGSVNAAGSAEYLAVAINGAGGFQGPDLQTGSANVSINGFGRAVVWAEQSLTNFVGGFGSIDYYGSPNVSNHVGGLGWARRVGDK